VGSWSGTEARTAEVAAFLKDVLAGDFSLVAGPATLGVAVGVGTGVIVGVALTWLTLRSGLFTMQWRPGRWLRWLAVAWLLLAVALLGGVVGAGEGALFGLGRALREGRVRERTLRPAARAGIILLGTVDGLLTSLAAGEGATLGPEGEAALNAFEQGEREIDLDHLSERLKTLEAEAGSAVAAAARAQLDSLGDGLGPFASMLSQGGDLLGGDLVKGGARAALAGTDLDPTAFLAELPAYAARSGDPRGISAAELEPFLLDRFLVPAVEDPLRRVVRAQEKVLGFLAFTAWLAPVVFFWLARRIEPRVRPEAPRGPRLPRRTAP
jgi:hypothetical protein